MEHKRTYEMYTYYGPVMQFDTCIANNWYGTTYAKSEKQARTNLTYQFKKQNNLLATSKITLPGVIKSLG